MPNKKNIKLWVKALRSGKFKQGTGALRDEKGRYCCLGVAQACYRKYTNCHDLGYTASDGCAKYSLHKRVAQWLGIEDYDPHVSRDKKAFEANDFDMWTFEKIADEIERYYLKS